jgi:hypothetical protein
VAANQRLSRVRPDLTVVTVASEKAADPVWVASE